MKTDGITRRALGAGLIFTLASATSAGALVEPTVNDEGSGDARVVPLSNSVASVSPGDSEWIAINWTSLDADARELKVTAIGSDGVAVGYPAFPVDGYSSGMQNDTLSQSEVDYTALKLSVADDVTGQQSLTVTVTYVSDTGPQSESFLMPFGSGTDEETPSPTTTPVSTTAAPTTAVPTTAVPTTAAPTTAAPTTAAPVPTTATPTTAAPSTTEAAPLPEVISFVLVDTNSDTEIGPLVDGDEISRSEVGRNISVVAIANDVTESVRFQVDGRNHRVEQYVPYAVQGDIEGDYARWRVEPGTYTLNAIPFGEDYAEGVEGISKTITITIVD